MLDFASLQQILIRLNYDDLLNIGRARPYLYRIICIPEFSEEWKRYNIRTEIQYKDGFTIHTDVDTNNTKHGKVIIMDGLNNITESSTFVAGVMHGDVVRSRPDGRIEIRIYHGGIEHGCRTYSHPDVGIFSYDVYQKGVRHGLSRFYPAEGFITWAEYSFGQVHGKHIRWDDDGTLMALETFNQGNLVGKQYYWYPNGQKLKELTKDGYGNYIGYYCEWFPNGFKKLEFVIGMNGGYEENTYNEWTEDGTLRCQ
jgi:antitoxin component YwqK of YwqJK toxin-antitoxin module